MTCKITKADLISFGTQLFQKAGLNEQDAERVSTILATNDERGVYSHGTTFYYGYTRLLRAGGANPTPNIQVEGNGPFRQVNGDRALGPLAAYEGMKQAIAAAKQYGIGLVTVKKSTHFAAAGYYAMMAAEEGMIGLSMGNGDPVMSIPGTKGRVLGNNPFAYAAPLDGERTILFDVAMSVIAGGKIKNFVAAGKKVPDGWMVDKDGNPTTDPEDFAKGGTLMPFAMHKGYGFAIMVELLAGVLSGSGIVRDNTDWFAHPDFHNDLGHCMIVIDPSKVFTAEEFQDRVQKMKRDIMSADTVGDTVIMLPGEMEYNKTQEQKDYIELNEALTENIGIAASEWGLSELWESLKK